MTIQVNLSMLKQMIWPIKVNSLTGLIARHLGKRLARDVESFVFVSSTGRSGTNTLANLFNAVPECVALHEPHPVMKADILRAFNNGDELPMWRTFRCRKLPHIYWAARGHRWYVETNHFFIKCFAEAAVEAFGARLRVIHLVRDANAVAVSRYHRRMHLREERMRLSEDGVKPRHGGYTFHHDQVRNLIRPWDDIEGHERFNHEFFQLIWHWYEVEARLRQFRDRHPHVPVYRLETNQMNNPDAVREMLEWAGMPFTDAVRELIGHRANASSKAPRPPDDLDAAEVEAFHERCQALLNQF